MIRGATHDPTFRKTKDVQTAINVTAYRNTIQVSSVLGTGTTNYFMQAITQTSGVLNIGDGPTSRRRKFTINAVVSLRQV